jgi:magnesium-transporting ATPase (P-type)
VQFDLTKFTNLEIYENFSEGVKTIMEYNYLLNKYGENIMKMEDKTFSKIILKKFLTPLIIYRIFIVFIWIKIGYYSFLIVVAVLSISLLLITSYQKYLNFKRIFNDNYLYEIPKMEEVIHLIFLCF